MNLVLGGISMKKKVFSLVLVLCMMLDAFPTSAKAAAIRTQEQAVQWATYCANTSWEVNDGSGYTQCTEFVAAYYEYLTGTFKVYGNASYYLSDNSGACLYDLGWTRPDVSSAQPGDIFIQDGDPGHMGVIVGRSGSTLTTAEANGEKTNEHSGMPVPTGACALYDNRSIYDISGLIRPAFSDPTPAPVAPNAPSVNAVVSGKTVDVTWNDVGASSYYLYVENRATGAQPFSQNLGKTFSCHLELGAANWRVYVSAVYADGTTKSSSTDFTIQPDYKAPTVSASVNGKTVDISWNDVGAVSYELHVFNKNTGAVAYSNDMGKVLSAHLELSGGTWQANVTAMFDGMDGGMAGSCEFTILSSYTISYDANGGNGAPASQTKTQGTALALSNDKPTRADAPNGSYTVTLNANGGAVNQTSFTANSIIRYAFTNWNTASNGSGTSYAAGASYTADADVALYAQWESTAITDPLTLPTPSRDGYSFLGWAGSPTDFNGITGVYTPTGSITLYAIWGIYTAEAQTPHEHSWDDGVVQKTATAEETGIMLYTCTVCGETKTEEIPKLEPEVLSGKCGDNVLWEFEDGTLTIFGSGDMYGADYERVPWYSFRDEIRHVFIESEVTSVGNNAFYDCENLIDVSISGPVTSFGNYAFYNCKSLSYVSIPETLTSVGTMAFNYCENLNNITLPATMSEIGWDVFTDCKKLTRFVIPNGLTQIPQGLLNGCSGLTEIVIPENVTYIGPMAFAGCSALEEIILPSGIMDVQSRLFEGCSSLKNISIPENVGSIGPDAFYNCTSLAYVVIPKSITRVYNNAFENCSALKEVYFGGSADDWDALTVEIHNDDLINAYIHYNSTGPKSEIKSGVCGDNLTWHLDDEGVLTVSGIGRMYDYSDTVDSGAPWFPVKDQIKKVVLGEGVLSIGDYAFDRCEKLAHIAVPVKTISVGRGAFNRCVSLTSVTFPTNGFEGVSEIGIGAFSECSNLTNITLPDTLTTVWDSAFFGCTALADIYYMGYEKDWISVIIQPGNECLTEAEFHSKQPTAIDVALQGSSAYYDNDLALIAAELSLATYTGDGDSDVRAYLCGLGFSSSKIYSNNYGGSLAFTIGTKPYFGNDMSGCTDILVIVAQGSTNPYELFKDAFARVTGTGGYLTHSIVEDYYNAINEGLQYMMDRNLLSNDKNYKIFLTGHSLGGAAVDFLAGILTDNNGANDVYCYTFGAINSIVANSSLGYRNIHNVYNDLDTFSPAQYGWMLINGAGGKYGKIGHLDSFEYDYRDPVLASWWGAVVQVSNHINHDMGNYLEAVRAGRVTNSPLRSCPYAIIACPVDVDVFCDGVLVGRVKNNVVDKTVTTIDIIVDGDVKFILNPENKKFDITITAFDEGTMTYYTQNSSGFGEAKLMYNIELVPGKEMISQFGGDIEIPDIKLYVLGGDDTPIREVHEDGTETAITHIHKWDEGVITTPATCDADGVMTYTCSVCGETKTETISAAGHKWDAGTVTKAATCTEAGVMTYTCTACGINGTTEIPALGHNYEGGVCKTCGGAQPGFAPKIIEGSGGTAHYGSDYSFRSDAAFNTFLAVYVDGAELSATNYTAKEGSTIITLKGSYIKTLAAGTHTIRIASTLGNADGTFKVSESPKTGDTSDLFKWSFLAIDSFVCFGCLWGLYLLASKKRRAYDPRH